MAVNSTWGLDAWIARLSATLPAHEIADFIPRSVLQLETEPSTSDRNKLQTERLLRRLDFQERVERRFHYGAEGDPLLPREFLRSFQEWFPNVKSSSSCIKAHCRSARLPPKILKGLVLTVYGL